MALQAQKACEQGVPVMANKKDVMGYVAPADTEPLLNLLGGSKQLLRRFQGLLGLQLAGPSASCQTPVGKICGSTVAARKAELLAQLISSKDDVEFIKHYYTSSSGSETEAAFVRWLVAKRPAVKDKKHAEKPHFGAAEVGSADIVELSSILGPCYVQPDPIKSDTFYFNRWVDSTL
ncbi:TPA: hypothetical protein ACH3X1_014717 [Trebouxia sp. C0004]